MPFGLLYCCLVEIKYVLVIEWVAVNLPREILPIFNATLVVFIPNFTTTHAIASYYHLIKNSPTVKKRCAAPKECCCEKRCEIQSGGQEMAVMVG